jgi:sarcosine oxidase subunit beta
MRERGRDVSLLDADTLADRFPALRTDHLAVGAVAANAGYVDTDAFVAAMVEHARSVGVSLRLECPVSLLGEDTLSIPDGRHSYDSVLLAAGPHTHALAAEAGHSLALGTYRAQVAVVGAVPTSPPVFYDATERFYLRPAGAGLLVGDGAHRYDGDPDEYDPTADASFIGDSLARIESALGESASVVKSWAGLCTATPDRDPLVGALSDRLFVATGWHGHGFMRAPAIGAALAEQLLGGAGIDHFDPTRFDGDEAIDLPDGIAD